MGFVKVTEKTKNPLITRFLLLQNSGFIIQIDNVKLHRFVQTSPPPLPDIVLLIQSVCSAFLLLNDDV